MQRIVLGVLSGIALCAVTALPSQAALVISAGEHVLQPNLAGQEIQILITGGDPLQGATVTAEIGGLTPLPAITGGDIVNGTIFEANNNGAPSYDFSLPNVAYLDVATLTGSVNGNGILARLFIDTTNIDGGVFTLSLSGTEYGDSSLTTTSELVTFAPGSITVVPEPAALSLLAGVGLLALRRRRA